MPISKPDLPYADNALEPVISAETISYHYGKHHQAYVNKCNELTAGTPLENADVETIIVEAAKDKGGLYNQAAQVWNHTFYWDSMAPGAGGAPTGEIAAMIDKDFGSFDEFKAQFKAKAVGQFGSGWAWLVKGANGLAVTNSLNADTPLGTDEAPLLVCDVWEHAYYLDHQNKRPDYVDAWMDNLVSWDKVNERLAAA
ncbi:MAG: superoxide dismutase [Pseudomonadota bacterium]